MMDAKDASLLADEESLAIRHDYSRARLKNLFQQRRNNTGPKRSDAVWAELRDSAFAELKRLDREQACDLSSLSWTSCSVCEDRFMYHIGMEYKEDAAHSNVRCVRLYPSPVIFLDMLAPRTRTEEGSCTVSSNERGDGAMTNAESATSQLPTSEQNEIICSSTSAEVGDSSFTNSAPEDECRRKQQSSTTCIDDKLEKSSACLPPALGDRGHGSFDREYYIGLTAGALSPVQLLGNYVRAHDISGSPELPRTLTWEFETFAQQQWYRARCGFLLAGRKWMHVGPWRCSEKLARTHCAALILELFQVDPYAFGGTPGRSMLSSASHAEHAQIWKAIQDVTDRLSKMRQILIRFPSQLGQGLETAGKKVPKQVLEWSFEQKSDTPPDEYRASCFSPLLLVLGWSCSTFTGDWARSKQAAKQSACLVLQAYLDSIQNYREAVHTASRRAKRFRRKMRWNLKKKQMAEVADSSQYVPQ